jgi:OmpA family
MYLYENPDRSLGFGLNPAAVIKAIEVGSAALSFGRDLFTGGNFSTTSSFINYVHESTPLDQIFKSCERKFQILAYKPSQFPLEFAKKYNMGEKFFFKLSYQYNGNDLRNVAVEPLLDASSTLIKSEFNITFAGDKYSLPRDPVAEVVFHIGGRWKAWDPLPLMDTVVSFSGELYVRADGFARIENFNSEKGYVWPLPMTNNCPVIAPYTPKVPISKQYWLPVFFQFNKHEASDQARKIYDWFSSWPDSTKGKIARGEITVIVEGFASRPGGELYNLDLSEKRAKNVMNILSKFSGSNTKFDFKSYGKFKQNLPGFLNVVEWLKRFFDTNKYDQAAIIRFVDIE